MLQEIPKIAAIPLYPIGLTFVLILASVVFLLFKKNRTALFLSLISGVVLYAFSTDLVAHLLMREMEKRYLPSVEYPKAAAIVLLGGSEVPQAPPRLYDETNFNADRIFNTVRLFRKGLSPRIVITGGGSFGGSWTEAKCAFNLMTESFGIDSGAFLLEEQSLNTYENAVCVGKLFDKMHIEKRIILVTSAYHMARAAAVFRKQSFTVYPAAADYYENEYYLINTIRLLPSVDGLFKSSLVLHELYGLLTYKILGWI